METNFRNNERQNELILKQNARKDLKFKQKEKVAKQISRQDEDFRNTERQKELYAKQTVRKILIIGAPKDRMNLFLNRLQDKILIIGT